MIEFTTTKIDRYAGANGYMIQIAADEENARQIDDFLRKHVNGVGTIEVILKKPSKKRTLTANAYLWVLCDDIAKTVGTDKEAVYKTLIRRVGVFDYVLVKSQAADRFVRNWENKGLGWFADEVLYKESGIRQFMVYYGTSVYDREQMARVIDEAIQEARDIGLGVKTKKEVKELIEAWAT